MKKIGKLGLAGIISQAFPLFTFGCKSSEINADSIIGLKNVSLREIVEKKLHHLPDQFLNPFPQSQGRDFFDLLKWKFFSRNEFKDEYDRETTTPVSINWKSVKEHDGFSVTFIKHSSIMIKDGSVNILVDPVFHKIFISIKDFSPLDFALDEMPKPDHILITHGHYDHLSTETLNEFNSSTHIISPLGYDNVFGDLDMSNRTKLDWFESFSKDGLTITCLPCNHWTMRNPFIGPNRSLWSSFLVETSTGPTVFVSGDIAWFDHFDELGEMFDIDLAIFNLGAYEPRWFMKKSHMNPREVVDAFLQLKARNMMIVHWGSFRLGDEPIFQPPLDILKEMEKRGLSDKLIHLDHGQTVYYNNGHPEPVSKD